MKKTNAVIIALTVLVVLFILNFLVARHPVRFDLTQNKVYTLSDSTRKILSGLDDVVTIRAYFTQDLPPAMQSLRRDIDDILAEFKSAAKSKLQVEFINPNESIVEEQKASMLGIPPLQLNVVERDKQQVAKIYLGMTVLFGDKQQVMPVVRGIENLEYDLAESILKVSEKESPKIAWWAPAADEKSGQGFSLIKGAISRRYETTDINEKELPNLDVKKFKALVLISPRTLSNEELFAIDQYIMGGGNVIALIDRVEIAPSLQVVPVETNAKDLFVSYGVTVEDKLVVDQSNAMAAFSGGYVTYHLPYPFWPSLRRDQFSATSPIVSALESIVLPWTSPLVLAASTEGGAQVSALATTSRMATSIAAADAKLDPQSAGDSMRGGKLDSLPLVALVSGKIKSYFVENDKAVAPKGKEVIKESADTSRLFVVGSSRWVSDKLLQNFPSNAALFENALDSFAMGDVLIGIRSRENPSRPIEMLSDGIRVALKYINLVIGPVIVLIIGLVFLLIRRAKRRLAQVTYHG